MAEIKPSFGSGGANIQPGGHGSPSLAEALRDVADDLAGAGQGWQSGQAVAANVLVMPSAGIVVAVEATTAASAGVKQQQFSPAPAAGFVEVSYDVNGVPTLTFNGADAVTVAAVLQSGGPALKTTKG